MNTTSITQTAVTRAIVSVLLLASILAATVSSQLPAEAGFTNEHMERPYNDNGHPRSWIRVTGTCDADIFCEIRYKIQYSYWGWRNSGNSEIIATPNSNSWTGANATCNKSPGTYRGRMDLRYVNEKTVSVTAWYGKGGGSITIPATTTHWIRSSSPHAKGLEC